MSMIEDFQNAPVGAIATHPLGSRAMKIGDSEQPWITPSGNRYNDGGMVFWNYTLDTPDPTTPREALDLAWELARPVKEGQVIPKGARYLEDYGYGMKESTARFDIEISFHTVPEFRTLDPLPEPDPEPEPDWHDAPAVIAVCNDTMDRAVFVRRGDNQWRSEFYGAGTTDLRNVTPLYPKEGQDA